MSAISSWRPISSVGWADIYIEGFPLEWYGGHRRHRATHWHPVAPLDKHVMPDEGWTCFHCGETFRAVVTARAHFGATPEATPGCLLKLEAGERGLVRKLRGLEFERDELKVRLNALRLGADENDAVARFWALRGLPS